jgi:hypothetical protein
MPHGQARQTQLEPDVVRAWRNDSIAQRKMLRGGIASQDGPVRKVWFFTSGK